MKPPEPSRWLQIGRVILFGYAAVLIALSLAGAVMFPAYAQLHADEFTPNTSWTPALTQAGLAQLGWPATFPAYVDLGRNLLFLVAGGGVALLLLWRRPASWYILYLAFVLVSFAGGSVLFRPLLTALPGLAIYNGFMGAAGWQFFFILFFFFPDGHAVPRWTRWLVFFWLGLIVLSQFISESFYQAPLLAAFFGGMVLCALGSQLLRYFRRSNPVQRQQTKWIVLVLILLMVEGVGLSPWAFKTPSRADLRFDLVFALVKLGLDNILVALVPLAIFVAIFRYRLWDIDLVIRRTLAYGAITAILTLVYLGAITIFQQIFTVVSGQNSPVGIVLSTLLIAALFTPLRRRIQEVIDRRFFRQKYDAARSLEEFSNVVRNEVELETLTGSLAEVVTATVQPERVSLWLKKQDRKQ